MKKFIFIFLILFAFQVEASVLEIHTQKDSIESGFLNTVLIKIDTKGSSVNTIEGDLLFDKSLLKVESVNTGNSFISFWIDRPAPNDSGRIHFSGVVPGGVSITGGDLFSIVFRGELSGSAKVSLENVNVYLNDGEGSKDSISLKDASFQILENKSGRTENLEIMDENPPEFFKIERARSDYIYEGKWFIVFGTQDKGVGIAHYEICEFFQKICARGESPYELKHQNPFYYITVNAIDINGNTQKAILISPFIIITIILAVLIIFILFWGIKHRYLRKSRV